MGRRRESLEADGIKKRLEVEPTTEDRRHVSSGLRPSYPPFVLVRHGKM